MYNRSNGLLLDCFLSRQFFCRTMRPLLPKRRKNSKAASLVLLYRSLLGGYLQLLVILPYTFHLFIECILFVVMRVDEHRPSWSLKSPEMFQFPLESQNELSRIQFTNSQLVFLHLNWTIGAALLSGLNQTISENLTRYPYFIYWHHHDTLYGPCQQTLCSYCLCPLIWLSWSLVSSFGSSLRRVKRHAMLFSTELSCYKIVLLLLGQILTTKGG